MSALPAAGASLGGNVAGTLAGLLKMAAGRCYCSTAPTNDVSDGIRQAASRTSDEYPSKTAAPRYEDLHQERDLDSLMIHATKLRFV